MVNAFLSKINIACKYLEYERYKLFYVVALIIYSNNQRVV